MDNSQRYEEEIDLKDLMLHILYRWRSVLVIAVLVCALAGGYAAIYDQNVYPKERSEVEGRLQAQKDILAELKEQIENTQEDLNPALRLRGCLVTSYQRNDVNAQGEEWLRTQRDFPVFATHIRRTEKVDESTFAAAPIIEYSRRCGAAADYLQFVREYLQMLSDSDTTGKGAAQHGKV